MILGYPLFKFVIYVVKCLSKHFLSLHNFKSRYSSEYSVSWVVVTGATDGIGLGFCKALVRLGFNVVLISRNPLKLQSTVDQLKEIQADADNKSVFKTIVFDFKQSNQKNEVESMMA
jgi:17beta-estradiol 17-dehydrogenase / very-long-chain 3-oxoacyl-CoA reductase